MQLDRSVVLVLLHIMALSATVTWIIQSRRTRWLPIVLLLAVFAFSYWWKLDGHYHESPTWFLVFISAGYAIGTVASALLMRMIAGSIVLRLVLTVFGGFLSFFAATAFGFVLWTMT